MNTPILASTLYHIGKSQPHPTSVCSGHAGIDGALRSGITHGQITCISGEHATGKTTVALHLLVTHLLSSRTTQAAIIDSTGIDILSLHEIIKGRVEKLRNAQRALQAQGLNPQVLNLERASSTVDEEADAALERVRIMRVFDFVGLTEAINELRDELRSSEAGAGHAADQLRVEDSESDGEDVMLFDGAAEDRLPLDPPNFILVDNIAGVAIPLLKKEHVQGQALLSTFMRSLSHFARSENLIILLVNNAASYRTYGGIQSVIANADAVLKSYTAGSVETSRAQDRVSSFASTSARPALGKAFAAAVDLHIMLSTLPKRRRDAEVLIGGKPGKAETVGVLEVLVDNRGERCGRWAGFEVRDFELREPL